MVEYEDKLRTGYAYAGRLLREWEDIKYLSQEVRTNRFYFDEWKEQKKHERIPENSEYISTNEEKQIFYTYVSKLIGLYSELYSKVVSRSDLKVFAEQYKLFEKYHDRPELLLAEADMSQYAKMERLVGEALEKLKITTFEGML